MTLIDRPLPARPGMSQSTTDLWPAEPHAHRWTKAEYYQLGEAGFFRSRRVELINGEIIDMSPIGPLHAALVEHVKQLLDRVLPGYHARAQQPIDAGDLSEPQPDLAVVPGRPLDYAAAHPSQVILIVEVADWSLAYDRGRKASRYAASGIADYWVLNLPARQLEIFRDPQPSANHEFGFGYASHTIVPADGQVSPLAAPAVVLAVKDMLP